VEDPALSRLLTLAGTLLDTSRPLSFEEIRERMPEHYRQAKSETARRQFERDKDSLVDIGIEIQMVRSQTETGVEGYTAVRAKELEGLELSPDELAALHFAATRVALEGVDEDLVTRGVQKLGGAVGVGGDTVARIPMPVALGPLFGAVLHRSVATFTYNGVERELEPHRIGFERGHWYVAGFDRARGGGRNFRVDRIEGKVAAGPAGAFAAPERPREIRTEAWAIGNEEPVDVTLRLDREVASAFLHEYPEVTATAPDGDGRREVTLTVNHRRGLFNVVLQYMERAEVVGPDEVLEAFVEHLRTMAAGE
jgi:proteasome accessory factor B